MRMSWQSRPKDFFTDAPDAIIEVDTLGRNAYEAAKVTVGTEGIRVRETLYKRENRTHTAFGIRPASNSR